MPPIDEQVTTQRVHINKAAILQALQHDHEFFIQFFMADLLLFSIPPFHLTVFGKMIDAHVRKLALALPRGHNKTTLAKLAVVYYFMFTEYRFIVYVSNTAEISQAACRDIIGFLECDNFRAIFGDIEFKMKREGEGFYRFTMIMQDGTEKDCILRALGAGQQVRGINVDNERPQLGVVDDLEDDDNTATPQLQAKLKKWVYGPFLKCFNRWKQKIIWLGNMISNTCMLHQHCQNPTWHSMRLGAILTTGEPLWPDLWPIEALRADFEDYCKQGMMAKWFAEMMNMPLPEGGAIIRAEEIQYVGHLAPGDIEQGFITIDPAISKNTWANNSAVVVHGYCEERWVPVDYWFGKADPIQLFYHTMELAQKWGIKVIGIESVAYQAALEYFFNYLIAAHNYIGYSIVPLHAAGRKSERIITWASMLKNQTYWLQEGEVAIIEQLLLYDTTKKENDDDLIDSCAYGVQMIQNYLHLIYQAGIQQQSGFFAVQGSYDTCGV